jgi:hypothetical protein
MFTSGGIGDVDVIRRADLGDRSRIDASTSCIVGAPFVEAQAADSTVATNPRLAKVATEEERTRREGMRTESSQSLDERMMTD